MGRAMDRRVDDHERHLFEGSGCLVGEFECPVDSPRWGEVNAIDVSGPIVVFGESVLRISVDGGPDHLCTPNETLLYDAGVEYRRRRASRAGDRSTFIGIAPDLRHDLGLAAPSRPSVTRRSSSPREYLLGRMLRAELAEPDPDLLAVGDWCVEIVARAVEPAVARPQRREGGLPRAIDVVRALVADDPDHAWTVEALAREVHYSPWFLSRQFKQLTGQRLSAYRQQLRLRRSLDAAMRPGCDLAAVAADYGFSSHSHYTHAFRTAFGCAPSRLRSRAARIQIVSG